MLGVGHQHVVDGARRKGELPVGNLVPALLQTAVHQDPLPSDFQAMAAAGDTLVSTEKAKLHGRSSFFRAPPDRGPQRGTVFVSLAQSASMGKGPPWDFAALRSVQAPVSS